MMTLLEIAAHLGLTPTRVRQKVRAGFILRDGTDYTIAPGVVLLTGLQRAAICEYQLAHPEAASDVVAARFKLPLRLIPQHPRPTITGVGGYPNATFARRFSRMYGLGVQVCNARGKCVGVRFASKEMECLWRDLIDLVEDDDNEAYSSHPLSEHMSGMYSDWGCPEYAVTLDAGQQLPNRAVEFVSVGSRSQGYQIAVERGYGLHGTQHNAFFRVVLLTRPEATLVKYAILELIGRLTAQKKVR